MAVIKGIYDPWHDNYGANYGGSVHPGQTSTGGSLPLGGPYYDAARNVLGIPHIQPMLMDSHAGRMELIYNRMRLHPGDRAPVDFIATHVADDKVFLFLVQNGKPAIFEDDAALFPSDTLVTQLNLIRK